MKKRGFPIIFSLLLLTILFLSLTSAGMFSELWSKITGKATSGPASLNITIGNSAPTIEWVETIASTPPTDDGTKTITFNFSATDIDGYTNINVSTAEARFELAGETTRNASCTNWSQENNIVNFTCAVDMFYFDKADNSWIINVTVFDINSARGINASTVFTYEVHTGLKVSPPSVNWSAEIGIQETDTGSTNDPLTVNNTGNDDAVSLNVTAYNLRGEVTTTEFIYANNFTVENESQGCTGTEMVNASSINVTSAILYSGNHSFNYNNATSGQEQMYFCLRGVPQDISPQSYSSSAYGSWQIEVVT